MVGPAQAGSSRPKRFQRWKQQVAQVAVGWGRRWRPHPVPPQDIAPGLYVYQPGDAGGRRFHLRVEADGAGVLLIDVTDAVHLNPTATLLVKLALDTVPVSQAAGHLRRRFRGVDRREAQQQAERIYAMVDHFLTARGCPTCGLKELTHAELFSTPVRAPYKADLALTYGCNNACRHCYNEQGRKGMGSLSLDQWRQVLDRLAAVGVPHLIFTGGEPTLFPRLADLIRHACGLGLVTGMNTNGRRLADCTFATALAQSGLSHVQITLESCQADVHNAMTQAASFDETVAGIRRALDAGLYTITNTTLTWRNRDHVEATVDFLHDLGLRTIAFNGMIYAGGGRQEPDAIPESQLGPLLVRLRDRVEERGMRLLWYTPTAWCRFSPMELDLGPRRCNAAEYSICIEPNGDVLPCQSYYQPAGNLLRDPWPSIWESPLFHGFRHRTTDPRGCGLPEVCWECPDLAVCGGGCRLRMQNDECRMQNGGERLGGEG
jgi:radical SAM protein with 4Fe4S-binding SPASM domain